MDTLYLIYSTSRIYINQLINPSTGMPVPIVYPFATITYGHKSRMWLGDKSLITFIPEILNLCVVK